jgi:cephalosporin hydroxylase
VVGFRYSGLKQVLFRGVQTQAHRMQDVSKRALQCYSKCYCVASVTKTFTLKGVQTIHRQSNIWNTIVQLFYETPTIINESHIEP